MLSDNLIETSINPERFVESLLKIHFQGAEIRTVSRNDNLPAKKLSSYHSQMIERIKPDD